MPTAPSSRTINYDNVNTFTEAKVIPELRDTIFNSNALMMMLDQKKRRLDGGVFIKQPLLYAEGPFAFFDGRSPIDISEAEQFTSAIYTWKWAAASASIAMPDEAQNSGEAATMSLLQNKYKAMVKTFQNGIGQGIYSAGTNPNEITGLQSAVAGSGTTYGNISGTNYSWWRSVVRDMSSVPFSDPEFTAWEQDMTEGQDEPDAYFANKTVRGYIYNSIEPMKRIVHDKDTGNLGFSNIELHGKPFYTDSHSPASTLWGINFDYAELVVLRDWDMKFIPWDNWTHPFMKTCYIVSGLNLVLSNRRFEGKMTNLTA
jgi:hypothetical protein